MNGTLYIAATPIGNLEDITPRTKRILSEVDIIAAEDTRMSRKLLGLLSIKNKTVSYHKFNEQQQLENLLGELKSGCSIALVSDAGTPCISDPGGLLVNAAAKLGIPVVGVGGISAATTALSVSGFIFDSFSFYGFLPRSANDIKKRIAALQGVVVFFESPKRIIKSLHVFASETPDAGLCLCNDLTKMHERIYRGTPQELITELQANPSAEKGEYTLVVQFPSIIETESEEEPTPEALLVDYMVKNKATLKEAINALAKKHKNKKEWYAASLRLRQLMV